MPLQIIFKEFVWGWKRDLLRSVKHTSLLLFVTNKSGKERKVEPLIGLLKARFRTSGLPLNTEVGPYGNRSGSMPSVTLWNKKYCGQPWRGGVIPRILPFHILFIMVYIFWARPKYEGQENGSCSTKQRNPTKGNGMQLSWNWKHASVILLIYVSPLP